MLKHLNRYGQLLPPGSATSISLMDGQFIEALFPQKTRLLARLFLDAGGGRKYAATTLSCPIGSKDIVLFQVRRNAQGTQ